MKLGPKRQRVLDLGRLAGTDLEQEQVRAQGNKLTTRAGVGGNQFLFRLRAGNGDVSSKWPICLCHYLETAAEQE